MHNRWRWWGWVVIGLLGLGGMLAPRLHAAEPPLPWEAFWLKVSVTQTQLAQLQPLAPAVRQASLQALADDWATVTAITLPAGEVVGVEMSAWVAALRAPDPDLTALAQTLAGWVAARDATLAQPHTPQDLRALAAILQQPEFRAWADTPPSPLEEWWQNLNHAFWQWLNDLLPDGQVIVVDGLWVDGFALLIALVLVWLLGYILRGVVFNVSADANWLDPQAAEATLSAETALKRAQTLAEIGDHRAAVRYLYLSALLSLEERGLLRYDRSLTNWEYVRQVRHTPALADLLQTVVDVFDRVWYGYQPVDAALYARYVQNVNDLRQQR